MKSIPLTHGKFAIVDDEDYEWLMQWKWQASEKGYATRTQWVGNGKQKRISMHRLINKTPDGLETDHINGNRLDNRKCNLRTCTNAENQQNRRKKEGTTSVYKGVHWNSKDKRWYALIKHDGKTTYLGSFKNEIDAATTYNKAASEIHGEFARINNLRQALAKVKGGV